MKRSKLFIILALLMLLILFIPAYLNSVECSAKIDTTLISEPSASDDFKSTGETILGVIQAFGVGISVVVLAIIGVKYLLGSAEEKAEYKETMKPYIIGVAFLGLASTIPTLIYNLDLF